MSILRTNYFILLFLLLFLYVLMLPVPNRTVNKVTINTERRQSKPCMYNNWCFWSVG
jgi:hypothetical protein